MLNKYYVPIAIVSGIITSKIRIDKNLDFRGGIIMVENRKKQNIKNIRHL